VRESLDLQLHNIEFVPARWLIKSSSGKIARKANVERWKNRQMEKTIPVS